MANSGFGGGYASRNGLTRREPLFGAPGTSKMQVQEEEVDIEAEIEGLRGQVGQLKEVSKAIREENTLQAKIGAELENALVHAKNMLRRAQRKLDVAYRQSKSNHLLFVVLFAVAVLFLLYFIAKVMSVLRWIFRL
ncbi:unnamed protein product [Pedinophyceae sp. YPF-701]|nr:unnamed protein product [Pedinophyceae sp. YPF-701]